MEEDSVVGSRAARENEETMDMSTTLPLLRGDLRDDTLRDFDDE